MLVKVNRLSVEVKNLVVRVCYKKPNQDEAIVDITVDMKTILFLWFL